GSGAWVLVRDGCATGERTGVVFVLRLFNELGSAVIVEVALAVLVTIVPVATAGLTFTTMVKVTDCPSASVKSLPMLSPHVAEPVPLVAGVVQLHVLPWLAGWVSRLNVVLAGTVSETK